MKACMAICGPGSAAGSGMAASRAGTDSVRNDRGWLLTGADVAQAGKAAALAV